MIHYPIARYRNLVSMSNEYFLLVEGSDDKRLFKMLLEELCGKERGNIHVHSAEEIKDNEYTGLGNREKVETITRTIEVMRYANRYVGFVDREFREFEIGDKLYDRLGRHWVSGRLVWSRGHSIENYYFDFSTLRHPLRTFAVTDHFDEALDLFEQSWQQVIRLACALSLAARDNGNKFGLVKRSIGWDIMTIDRNKVLVDINAWKRILVRRMNMLEIDASGLMHSFESWSKRVEDVNFEIIRWLCHGHIGLATVWAAYGTCVFEACRIAKCVDPKAEAHRVLKAEESVRFGACADTWVQKLLSIEDSVYPIEILNLLSVPVLLHKT